jgi:hypothetical protein
MNVESENSLIEKVPLPTQISVFFSASAVTKYKLLEALINFIF